MKLLKKSKAPSQKGLFWLEFAQISSVRGSDSSSHPQWQTLRPKKSASRRQN